MASPWKFLARLVSPRRERRERNGSIADVKPEALTSGEPSGPVDDRGMISGDRPASEEERPHDQPDAGFAEPKLAEETVSKVEDGAGSESAESVAVSEAVSSDAFDFVIKPTHNAAKSSTTANVTTRKDSKRRKTAETGDVIASPIVPTFSDEAMALDEEIRVLRDGLARKLRLQNAQLRTMLGRFER